MYVLDAKKDKTKRMFFLDSSIAEGVSKHNRTTVVKMGKNNRFRDTFTVYLARNIHDKLTSLDAQVILPAANLLCVHFRHLCVGSGS